MTRRPKPSQEEYTQLMKLLKSRANMSMLEVSNKLKQKVSFSGIYKTPDINEEFDVQIKDIRKTIEDKKEKVLK